MNERFAKIRETLGMNQRDFGAKIGLSSSGISNIEKGFRSVTEKHVKLLHSIFNVNETWLRTGEGSMFVEQSDDPAKALCTKYNLPPSALSILNAFLSMDEKSRLTILDFTHRLAADLLENDYESLRPYLVTGEPVEGLHAARGGGIRPLGLDDRAGTELDKIPESKDDL